MEINEERHQKRLAILREMLEGQPQKHPVMGFVNRTGMNTAMQASADRRAAEWAAHNASAAMSVFEKRRAAAEADEAKRAKSEKLQSLLENFKYSELVKSLGEDGFLVYLQDQIIDGPLTNSETKKEAQEILKLMDELKGAAGGGRRRREKARRRRTVKRRVRKSSKSRRQH